ncbi:MAG: hypothetical protein ABSH20_28630 [Tepidisphaeraceae bacterium]|jgi:hypothetical protein
MKLVFLSVVLCVFGLSQAQANVGVYTGQGQSLRQITSKTVQMVSEEIVITPGRGRFLFDGGVAGLDQVEYSCKFVLRNLTDEAAEVQVGFPVDSQFARGEAEGKDDGKRWVLDYSFIVRDEETTYHIDFVRREPKDKNEARATFVWKMRFTPKETKTLDVQYRIPMSVTRYSTQRQIERSDKRLRKLTACVLESTGYITETGSSWAGNVEKATFTIDTEPFERYLDWRGFIEKRPAGVKPEEIAESMEPYPVQHPWWFRQTTPEGSKVIVKDGKQAICWEFRDFKPKKPIELRYYVTQIPRLPQEVDAFVDSILKSMPEARKKDGATELEIAKQILLATYGKEPEDGTAKEFVAQQVWYSPRKDFSMSRLTDPQQAVLKELERRIAACNQGR